MPANETWRRSAILSMAGLLLVTGLPACSAGPHRDGAVAVARSFVAAVSNHEGGAACHLLTPDARDAVIGATNSSCPAAVLNVKEQGSRIGRVAVWGDSAQVHIGRDVVFLLRERGGWQVSAAGCTAQPDAPYKCDVDG